MRGRARKRSRPLVGRLSGAALRRRRAACRLANGLKIVVAEDPDGYRQHTVAGLIVATDNGGTGRFTRVCEQVPDDSWSP